MLPISTHRSIRWALLLTAMLIIPLTANQAVAQESASTLSLADGKLQLTAPESWERKRPAVSIIEYEFAIPPSKGDTNPGRLTVMGAGGSVEANIDRWYAQFSQPDGGSSKDRAKVKKLDVAGQEVHLVDVSGTFKDQRGPMSPAVERPKYRMLAAIIATKAAGNYFIKLYGPEQTMAENEKAFVAMIEGMKAK